MAHRNHIQFAMDLFVNLTITSTCKAVHVCNLVLCCCIWSPPKYVHVSA